MAPSPAERHLRTALARCVVEGRQALGWSQSELARRANVSSGSVSLLETGRVNATLELAGRVLEPLGVVLDLRYRIPYSDTPQRDRAHARCAAYVQRRLERAGWTVVREVEVGAPTARGWIDALALSPDGGHLLVIEIKTVLLDVGRVERTLGWYRRNALAAARRLGWRPMTVSAGLLLLLTDVNDRTVRENREALRQSFPARATELLGGTRDGLAMIDPSSRRRDWLVRSRVDGRRSGAPYADYRDFIARRSMPGRGSATAPRGSTPGLQAGLDPTHGCARTAQRD